MKKIKYIFLFISITFFFACERDKNKESLQHLFWGETTDSQDRIISKLKEYDSFNQNQKTLFYKDEFINNEKSLWKVFDDATGRAFFKEMTGNYVVEAKQNHYNNKEFEYDQNRDFQIEFLFSEFTLNSMSSASFVGVAYNSDDEKNGFALFIKRWNGSTKEFVLKDLHNEKRILASSNKEINNTELLITLRKIESRAAFFINKEYLFQAKYSPAATINTGYLLSKGTQLTIKELRIEYLD